MHTFTSEQVLKGHPDKVADFIADSILDAYLVYDPNARVAVEVLLKADTVVLAGEVTSGVERMDLKQIVNNALFNCGYDPDAIDNYIDLISKQSPNIHASSLKGAGDQGSVIGFACLDTVNHMPPSAYYANKIAELIDTSYITPYTDGKIGITVKYGDSGEFCGISKVVASVQHPENISIDGRLRALIVAECGMDCEIIINPPNGLFVNGGFQYDCGLTGRKIICDTYGGCARHGGGSFSGKDATKVDRSGAYLARFLAKSVIVTGLANACEIQLSFAMGYPKPVDINVNTFGPYKTRDENEIVRIIEDNVDLSLFSVIEMLDLKKPLYTKTTRYGHFGKSELPWEKLFVMRR